MNYRLRTRYWVAKFNVKYSTDFKLVSRFISVPLGLTTAFSCVRPVMFQALGSPFISVPGTGFLARFAQDLFFITAKHVVTNFDINHIVVCDTWEKRMPLPVKDFRCYDSADVDDTDHADIAMFLLDSDAISEEILEQMRPVDIQYGPMLEEYSMGMQLSFCGVSPERSVHDYEINDIRIRFISGHAIFDGASNWEEVYKLRVTLAVNAPSYDGCSGGPVFYVHRPEDPNSYFAFAGMLIRGNGPAGILHFISSTHIFMMLQTTLYRMGRETW